MAFDDPTRSRLQKFVADARSLLIDEFTKQFQHDYGLDPELGAVAPLESLAEIDDRRLGTARILREILDHYIASDRGQGVEGRKAALDRMIREQAFTTLNRLAALRLMEARGIVLECVAKGYQSMAFQLYQRVAGTGLGETGDAYRAFLLSLCDLYRADLPLLFDRYFPNGRLFPREPALLSLLELINAAEVEPLWAEDETIGWIYQYFNSKEERKMMREASAAPRNSRELAVRNQFFTPRYVVEFLVDNTLGRLWFNSTGGQTGLRDRCQYLLVKPGETPEPARQLRDPRTIKLLDPACGSMHFGLYAFDLFLAIYREAWAWEQAHGPGSLDTKSGRGPDLLPLCRTYADEAAYSRDVPRLIVQHNIYGVDIDPRSAQIASLALWLRSQRAWHEAGVKAQERPQVGRGHVVAAVAPPAESELRKRFMEELDPLDAVLFEKTLFLLKGLPELGVLLQVEKELPRLIRSVIGEHGALFEAEDIARWQQAEARLRVALTEFATAARSSYQRRLFADDALQGLKVIDICRDVFDVVVMNPPYGDTPLSVRSYLQETYTGQPNDLFGCFVERSIALGNFVGSLTSRTFLFFSSFENLRTEHLFKKKRIGSVADLGFGVLDDAMVETCAMTLESLNTSRLASVFFRVNKADNKGETLRYDVQCFREGSKTNSLYEIDQDVFLLIDGCPMPYWLGPGILGHLTSDETIYPTNADIRLGAVTSNNEQFLRLRWEVNPTRINSNHWATYAKGGDYSKFYGDIHLLIDWRGDGAHILKSPVPRPLDYGNLINISSRDLRTHL